MKKLVYIITGLVLFLSSCADLEEKPIGVMTPESYFQSEGDLRLKPDTHSKSKTSYIRIGTVINSVTDI